MYYNGQGVDAASDIKARLWWTQAATQGHALAIQKLKILDKKESIAQFYRGVNYEKDEADDNVHSFFKARECYLISAKFGNAEYVKS